jgi:hypothetical protein
MAVRLCVAGVAWKGARVGAVLVGRDEIDWRGELEEDALRELLLDWFIEGQTTLTLSSQRPIRLVAPGSADSFELVVRAAAAPASGSEYSSLRLPAWALQPQTAAQANAQAVQYGLHWYGLYVGQWRGEFERSLCCSLHEFWGGQEEGLYQVYLEWNREWFPHDVFRRWQGVYAAFDRCGLTLVNFGREQMTLVRQSVESGLSPPSLLAEWQELGL